jgi:hypothetical protein
MSLPLSNLPSLDPTWPRIEIDRDDAADFTRITQAETVHSNLDRPYLYRTGETDCSFHNVLLPMPKESPEMVVYAWRAAGRKPTTSEPKKSYNEKLPATLKGGKMLLPCSANSHPVLPDTTPPQAAWPEYSGSRILGHGDGLIDLVVVWPADRR